MRIQLIQKFQSLAFCWTQRKRFLLYKKINLYFLSTFVLEKGCETPSGHSKITLRKKDALNVFIFTRQRTIFIVTKPSMHMAKAILIGNQFDKSLFAETIELKNFFSCERTRVFPYNIVSSVCECVFDVKLDLVDFPIR